MVSGSLGGLLLELLGQRKIIEKPQVFIAFSQCGVSGGTSERALGPSGGRGEVPWGPRGHQREPRESQESPQRGSGGVAGPPRAPRGGTWAPHGHGRVSPEVLAIAQPPRTWPLSSYRHDLSDLVLRFLELDVYTPRPTRGRRIEGDILSCFTTITKSTQWAHGPVG